MVAAQTFRQDLYYRISAFPVYLPPLRERREDIALLADSLLQRIGDGRRLKLAEDALIALRRYDFPGNVRELRNILERARLFADDGVIRLRDLPDEVLGTPGAGATTPAGKRNADVRSLAHALATFDGTRSELAHHLGFSERTLYRRIKALGLE
jgi:transcriptional regulator of acetoin/glycerol metabolism